MADRNCTCLSELADDAYAPGGPMSGKPKPLPCEQHSKRKRRQLGLGSEERKWFSDHGITPEGDAPLAQYTDLESWTAYVAWLLGDEANLPNNADFVLHCLTCNRDGMVGYRAAHDWLAMDKPPLPFSDEAPPRQRMIWLAALHHDYMSPNELREWAPKAVKAMKDETEFENPKPIAVMMQEVRDHSGRAGLIVIQRPDNLGWAFPAGYVEVGLDQSAEAAAAREFKEETGITPSEGFLFKSDITPVGGKLMLFVQSRGYLLDTELDGWKPTAEALAIRAIYEPEPLVFGTHQDAMASYFSMRSYLE
ncbi:RNA pyrophosphohydrolase [Sphingobium phage Lacusarx]|uniref:RNA pyrophosphohydrolase n=1 Tax=Sphingobium phage Lacusarx TaxID=1980139 RepID=A0A1W6DXQ2_9CAUD|nr:RNA pyrophosphohydrolase [Sphingobium phage Lacusarx]ARK07552.1 RNA pyrophosphohydrolase [Sphingobium phage Lacusarx]